MVVVGAAAAVWLVSRASGDSNNERQDGERAVANEQASLATPLPSPQPFSAFVPPTRQTGNRVILPVTFPDGSTAKLLYPADLGLADMGVRPYWVGCGGDFGFFHYDPYGTLYEGEPLRTWIGTNGQKVGLWRGVKGTGPFDHLIFHFDRWTVEKSEYRGDAASPERALSGCAEGLAGRVTRDGWIVLDGPRIVGLPRDRWGPPEGAELQFGTRQFLEMWVGPCRDDKYEGVTQMDGMSVDLQRDFASWCNEDAMVKIHVYFRPGSTFFQDVFHKLEVRNVRLAS